MILFPLILLISKNIYSQNYIKIPFKRTYKEKLTKNNYIYNLLNSELTFNISIGNPIQKIPINIKLNKYAIFISSSSIKEPKDIIKYNEKNSSSYEKISNKINYYSPEQEFSYGIESIDNFYINEKKNLNKKIKFILATSLRKNISGTLGLDIHLPLGQNLENINFIKQLKENNDINSFGFSFYFNEINNYYLIIGAYPNEYNSNFDINDLKKISVNNDNYHIKWMIKSENIIYDNKSLTTFKNCFFEPSINSIIGTKIYYDNIIFDFFNEYLINNKCKKKIIESTIFDSRSEFLFFYCDKSINLNKFKSIIFVFNHFNYELTQNELFELFDNEIYFLVGFKYQNDKIDETQNWIFGQPFFKKHILIFDQDNKIISFYTKMKKGFSFIMLFLVIFIIILILIIISLIFYFYKYIKSFRKIRANELDEQYEYLPKNNPFELIN